MTSYIKKEELQKIINESATVPPTVEKLITVYILSYLMVAIISIILVLVLLPLLILLLTPLLILSIPFISAEYLIKIFFRKNSL